MAAPSVAAGAYAAAQRLSSPDMASWSAKAAGGTEAAPGAFSALLQNAVGVAGASTPVQPVSAPTGAGAFSQLLQNAVTGVSSSGKVADAQTLAAAGGNADLVNVVTAVAESEAAIETLVAVRDRVVAAYEEIMRMPI